MKPRAGSRRRLVATAVIVAIVASLGAAVVLGARGSSDTASPGPSTSGPASSAPAPSGSGVPTSAPPTTAPSAADIAAARACQAFAVYVSDAEHGSVSKAVGTALVDDAAVLLQGAQQDEAAGRSLPPWASLGADLLSAAEDVVAGKAAALKTDGTAADGQCQSVSAAAAKAGGYTRGG